MDDAAPILISDRRSDAPGHARALFEYLSGRFGAERIFFDRSTIEGSDVFPDSRPSRLRLRRPGGLTGVRVGT
jgi:hypothetical protein